MSDDSLDRLVATREIIVCCGSGGVGKTSVAAAVALGAAARRGGRVLVLTIDPARRLATALGLEGIGNEARRVPDAVVTEAVGSAPRGELWAAMLDMKQSWDDLVRTYAEDAAAADRILENHLYRNLTSRFVQSHDYIAMERLFEIHSAGEYDLIVIDTPPTRNAIDFLEAPARMAEFFGGRFLRWLTLPYRVGGRRTSRVLEIASRPFAQFADRLLGGAFLEDIGEFFANFQSMYDGFVARAEAVERLLQDHRTTFAVVTTLEPAPLHEAERFCAALGERNLHLGAIVCNRTLPDLLLDPGAAEAAAACRSEADSVAASLAESGIAALDDPTRVARVLRIVGDSFDRFAVVARREAELRRELAGGPEVVARVPALAGDVGDVAALAAIARHLYDGGLPDGS